MAMEYLRDDHFRVIGSIETNASGKQVGRDAKYQRVGARTRRPTGSFASRVRVICWLP